MYSRMVLEKIYRDRGKFVTKKLIQISVTGVNITTGGFENCPWGSDKDLQGVSYYYPLAKSLSFQKCSILLNTDPRSVTEENQYFSSFIRMVIAA